MFSLWTRPIINNIMNSVGYRTHIASSVKKTSGSVEQMAATTNITSRFMMARAAPPLKYLVSDTENHPLGASPSLNPILYLSSTIC